MGSYGLAGLATGAQRHNDGRSDGAGGLGVGLEGARPVSAGRLLLVSEHMHMQCTLTCR